MTQAILSSDSLASYSRDGYLCCRRNSVAVNPERNAGHRLWLARGRPIVPNPLETD